MRKARNPKWWDKFTSKIPHYPSFEYTLVNEDIWPQWAIDWAGKNIPNQCPFERQYWIGDRLVVFIPALCPFNPLYEFLLGLKAISDAQSMEDLWSED